MQIPRNRLRMSLIRLYGVASGLGVREFGVDEGCPARYKAVIVDERKEPFSEVRAYGSVIHKALYLAEELGIPLLDEALQRAWNPQLPPQMFEEARRDLQRYMERGGLNLSTLAVEQTLGMPLMEYNGEKYFYQGTLDWIGLNPEDPTLLYYADYKTNRAPISQEDLDNDIQFCGYAALLRHNLDKIYPEAPKDVKIVGILEQLKYYTLYVEKNDEQLEMFKSWAEAVARAIIDDRKGKPVLNLRCNSCPIRFDCQEFLSLPKKGITLIDSFSKTTSLEERVKLMVEAEGVRRGLNSLIDSVKDELMERPGVYDGREYSIVSRWGKEYNLPELHGVMGAAFYSVVKVIEKRLEEYLNRNLGKLTEVEALRRKQVIGQSIKSRKVER